MTKKGKRILGVIMGAAVMMAAAGCGQSADSGTKDAQEVKVSENNAENADSPRQNLQRKRQEPLRCGPC